MERTMTDEQHKSLADSMGQLKAISAVVGVIKNVRGPISHDELGQLRSKMDAVLTEVFGPPAPALKILDGGTTSKPTNISKIRELAGRARALGLGMTAGTAPELFASIVALAAEARSAGLATDIVAASMGTALDAFNHKHNLEPTDG